VEGIVIDPPLTQAADEDFCIRVRRLHKRMQSSNPHEAAIAEAKLRALLARRGCVWDDLDDILAHTNMDDKWVEPDRAEVLERRNLLSLIESVIATYVDITDDERLAVASWILHTWVYDQYTYTPRLALLSPVFGCGKTTLLKLIGALAHDLYPRSINLSAAGLYRMIAAAANRTILVDEGNNQNLLEDKVLRAVLNGNAYDDTLIRATGVGGAPKFYNTFAPIAIGAKGQLPNDLLQRCIVINMHRHPPGAPPLHKLNERDPSFLMLAGLVRERIEKWARETTLNIDPDSPVRNRYADNWRPLLAIADSLDRGERVREVAVRMTAGLPDDDATVYLLEDIRTVFDDLDVDRVFTPVLLGQLHAMEDAPWSEWTGPDGNRPPHPITAAELARILWQFQIAPGTISPLGSRATRGASGKGYKREQFERAWASYCRPGAPSHRRTLRIVD
jgi:hypothetical protein